jgi:nucleoside-diphosphate-sugar epimerase
MYSWLGRHYSGRAVLVAGGNGFLGRNCVEALLNLGAEVSVIAREPSATPGVRSFCGDLRDARLVQKAIRRQTIVFDFAGTSGPAQSNRNPLENLDSELGMQLTLLSACSQEPSRPLLMFCSSRLVYGRPLSLPVGENQPLSPQSIYAAHKIATESYLNALAESRGLRYSIIRLSNPYGPHQPSGPREYGIINQFLSSAALGQPIRIYGDGAQRRDYIYVEDVISTFLLCAAERSCERQVFNLGGMASVPLREAAEIICELAHGTPLIYEPWPSEQKVIETGDYATDLRKLKAFVNLPPQVPLRDGFARTIAFYRHHPTELLGGTAATPAHA